MTELKAATRLRAGSTKELSGKLQVLIAEKEKLIRTLAGEKHNPTVAPSYWAARGNLEALVAVRDALLGSNINLNLL